MSIPFHVLLFIDQDTNDEASTHDIITRCALGRPDYQSAAQELMVGSRLETSLALVLDELIERYAEKAT